MFEVYSNDLIKSSLQTHLSIFSSNVSNCDGMSNISDIIKYIQNLTGAERELISQVITLTKLIVVMPATDSTSERLFSALCRVVIFVVNNEPRKIEQFDITCT